MLNMMGKILQREMQDVSQTTDLAKWVFPWLFEDFPGLFWFYDFCYSVTVFLLGFSDV